MKIMKIVQNILNRKIKMLLEIKYLPKDFFYAFPLNLRICSRNLRDREREKMHVILTKRQRNMETERQRNIEICWERGREKDGETARQSDRKTERQSVTQRHRETERQRRKFRKRVKDQCSNKYRSTPKMCLFCVPLFSSGFYPEASPQF